MQLTHVSCRYSRGIHLGTRCSHTRHGAIGRQDPGEASRFSAIRPAQYMQAVLSVASHTLATELIHF